MSAKLLTEHHLRVLSLKEGCTGSSESTHVKMPHCWKSRATAHFFNALTDISLVAPVAIQAASTFCEFVLSVFVVFMRNDITIVQNKSYKC